MMRVWRNDRRGAGTEDRRKEIARQTVFSYSPASAKWKLCNWPKCRIFDMEDGE
jgi:hypothetical protein